MGLLQVWATAFLMDESSVEFNEKNDGMIRIS